MKSLLAMILAMTVSMPAGSWAQQDQAALRRVHLMTGTGTIPRNPANRLEYLRYAITGEPRLTGRQMLERIPEIQKFARVTVESDEFIAFDKPQELKELSLRIGARLAEPDIAGGGVHARHQHDGGDGVFHESHCPERQASGDRGGAAGVQHA